jgi:hypothetical protein
MNLRAFSLFLLPHALLLGGCSATPGADSDAEPAHTGSSPGADCGPGWREACDAAGCSLTDPLWADCRLNGWSGYVAPETCALDVATGYAGDDQALCPPAPDDGFQLRFGPLDYADAAEVGKHRILPGTSNIECVYLELPIGESRYLGQLVGRVRPGVHHTQLRFVSETPTSGSDSEFCLPFGGEHVHMGQAPRFSVPDLSVPSPDPSASDLGGLDFEGGAIALEPGRVLAFELHYINATDTPILREGWINFYYQDPDLVRSELKALQLIGTGIFVAPHSTGTVRRSCATDRPRRVTHLQGHSHEGATRFSMWVHRAATSALSLVYESYDPLEPALLAYSGAVDNADPDPSTRRDGGFSGNLMLEAGDSLVWECEIENSGSTPIIDGGPNANGDQMCYVFGNFVTGDPEGDATWGCGASEPSPY